MEYFKVLKRAWEITWRYRALWIFGIILALTTAGWGGSGAGAGGAGGDGDRGGLVRRYRDEGWNIELWQGEWDIQELDELFTEVLPPEVRNTAIAIGVGLACVAVALIIAATIGRYMAETALIKTVDIVEETGDKPSVRQGLRLGWSRTTWRLFLISLLSNLPVSLAMFLLFLLSISPLLVWFADSTVARVIGTIATTGLFFLFVLLAIVVSTALTLLKRFFYRACALEDTGVVESIRHGFGVVRQHLKDVVIMWLIMIGVRFGWMVAMVVISIVLLPVVVLLIIIGGVLGGLPALLVGGLLGLLVGGAVPWIVGALIGIPIFILVVASPWILLGGLMEVFKSSTWTLTYRELRALEELEEDSLELEVSEAAPDPPSEPDEPDSE